MTDDERARLGDALTRLKTALDNLPEMSFAVDNAILDLERLCDGLTVTGHTAVKVGDRVRIDHRPSSVAGLDLWCDSMDATVGRNGLVVLVSANGNCDVSLTSGDAWWYPAECLVVLKDGE